jgi:transposase-like protein
MDPRAFKIWLQSARQLNKRQRARALRELGATEVADLAERATGVMLGVGLASKPQQTQIASMSCPHCGGDDIGRWGLADGKPRHRCLSCGKTFNSLTGTPLAALRYPDRWSDQVTAMINGETLAQTAKRCGVGYTTAFRWRHRFLEALNHGDPTILTAITAADRTFILDSFESKRSPLGKRSSLPKGSRKLG